MTNYVLPGIYPETEAREKLSKFWDTQIEGAENPMDAFSPEAFMDSLTACVGLLDLEEVLGVTDLPQTLVQRDGYKSKDDFVNHLIAQTKALFT